MREEKNIRRLIKLDIDIIGMIFYDKSPRFIKKKPDIDFIGTIKKAGVFVNAKTEYIKKKAGEYSLDIIQLHGNESPEMCSSLKNEGFEVFKAFGIDKNFDFNQTQHYEKYCSFFVFDTKTGNYGGSGRKYNWDLLDNYKGETPFLLSGGLSPQDINTLLMFKHPHFGGIDLNSGFELQPGIKNIELLQDFINKFRQ